MPSHYPNQCWLIVNGTPEDKFQWNSNRKKNTSGVGVGWRWGGRYAGGGGEGWRYGGGGEWGYGGMGVEHVAGLLISSCNNPVIILIAMSLTVHVLYHIFYTHQWSWIYKDRYFLSSDYLFRSICLCQIGDQSCMSPAPTMVHCTGHWLYSFALQQGHLEHQVQGDL